MNNKNIAGWTCVACMGVALLLAALRNYEGAIYMSINARIMQEIAK